MDLTLNDLADRVIEFRDERDWGQFHTPKDMAISLSVEAAELLEFMQWKSSDELHQHITNKRKDVGYELADILYWTLLLAHHVELDLGEVFIEKLEQNKMKYPIETARGSSRKYTELE